MTWSQSVERTKAEKHSLFNNLYYFSLTVQTIKYKFKRTCFPPKKGEIEVTNKHIENWREPRALRAAAGILKKRR
jgi:hypothetical protein